MAALIAQQLLKCLTISFAKRVHHLSREGIRRRWRRLTGKSIRPFRALLNPILNDADFCRAQRTGRRHLNSKLTACQSLVQPAARAVTGADYGDRAATHRVTATIQAKSIFL